jgi:hypothetical protein
MFSDRYDNSIIFTPYACMFLGMYEGHDSLGKLSTLEQTIFRQVNFAKKSLTEWTIRFFARTSLPGSSVEVRSSYLLLP